MGYAGQGLRKEGCGEEGDQSGYIASGEHVINRVLSGPRPEAWQQPQRGSCQSTSGTRHGGPTSWT